jgi:prepilin-type N-terminal cleavage/methylation domain-containing protein
MQSTLTNRAMRRTEKQQGFSLIEMLVVTLVITIIMGSVFKSINLTQQTSRTQQVKLDLTQQAREFIDQLTRDLRNSGYPYVRNMANGIVDPNNNNAAPYNVFSSAYDPYNAPGLIYVNNGSLWFAGDLDGSTSAAGVAKVKIVRYDYIAAGANEPNCPCLRRTEFDRAGGDPYTDASTLGAAVQQLEIQGVQNGNSAANPIFTVYDNTGNAITLPINFDSGATIAGINSLKVILTVQSTQPDVNGSFPVTTVVSSIALTNCSEALVNGQTPQYCQ